MLVRNEIRLAGCTLNLAAVAKLWLFFIAFYLMVMGATEHHNPLLAVFLTALGLAIILTPAAHALLRERKKQQASEVRGKNKWITLIQNASKS